MESKPRVIVITGANKGLGFELAKRLLKNPSKPTVIVTSRNETLGEEAVKELTKLFPASKDSVHYHALDITKKETYAPFLDWIKEKFGQIDVLVNNAGIVGDGEYNPGYKVYYSDALKVMGTNFLNTKEFTEYILPSLAADGKIISISSSFGTEDEPIQALYKKLSDPNFKAKEFEEYCQAYFETVKKQNFEEAGMSPSAYKTSKALLAGWTHNVLKEKLTGDQQAFTVDPGWCKTDMGTKNAPLEAEEGTLTTEYLIDLPYKANKETNGKFFKDCKMLELI